MKKAKIIIPCFNEEESLSQLFERLIVLEKELILNYIPHFVFIDDGSQDETYALLKKKSQELGHTEVIKHEINKNLGAALKTGMLSSKFPLTDYQYIVFLDSDCTYDPSIITTLIGRLDQGYDFATVSPYHPDGKVEGVPKWRLALSMGLTVFYRLLLKTNHYTYTAMVRAIRSDKIEDIISDKDDFSFVAEMFINAIKRNYRIVEIPTTLHVRKFGQSKMNILKTIQSHLGIIKDLLLKKNL